MSMSDRTGSMYCFWEEDGSRPGRCSLAASVRDYQLKPFLEILYSESYTFGPYNSKPLTPKP